MREFVVIGHQAPVEPGVPLDDLAGAGRLDLLCRAVNAALFTSHGIRSDVRVHLVHQDRVTISFAAGPLRNARPDERSLAGLVNAALEGREEAVGHQPASAAPGVTVRTHGLAPTLDAVVEDGPVIALHEEGDPVSEVQIPADPVFVLSDHEPFSQADARVLADHGVERIRLSPRVVHTDHAITLAHHWLDTAGYTRF